MASLVCTAFLMLTHQRNQVWSTEVSLWKEVVERHPDSASGWYGYGDAQRFTLSQRQEDEISRQPLDPAGAYRKAVELDPDLLGAGGLGEA